MNYLLYGLETSRLLFRPLSWEDFDAWLDLMKEPDAVRFLGFGDIPTPGERCTEWFTRCFKRIENNRGGMNVLIDRHTGSFIGQSGLLVQTVDDIDELEVAYSILPAHWNRGYATEAAKRVRDYAFENNLADSLISIVHVENAGSEKVAKNNGMTFDKKTMFRSMPVNIFRIRKSAYRTLHSRSNGGD